MDGNVVSTVSSTEAPVAAVSQATADAGATTSGVGADDAPGPSEQTTKVRQFFFFFFLLTSYEWLFPGCFRRHPNFLRGMIGIVDIVTAFYYPPHLLFHPNTPTHTPPLPTHSSYSATGTDRLREPGAGGRG